MTNDLSVGRPASSILSLWLLSSVAALAFAPIVTCSTTVARDEEVLRVVQIGVEAILDAVDHSRLQVNEQGARNVVLVVRLVEEDIFSVVALRGVLLQDALSADAVLLAQLLPKLVANYRQATNQMSD